MVSVTEKAAAELRNILEKEKKQGCGLRIFMAGFSCHGPQYGLTLEENPESEDRVLESKGVKVFLDKNMDSLLSNAEIDYIKTEQGSGFVINNPNAHAGSCGPCGGCD